MGKETKRLFSIFIENYQDKWLEENKGLAPKAALIRQAIDQMIDRANAR